MLPRAWIGSMSFGHSLLGLGWAALVGLTVQAQSNYPPGPTIGPNGAGSVQSAGFQSALPGATVPANPLQPAPTRSPTSSIPASALRHHRNPQASTGLGNGTGTLVATQSSVPPASSTNSVAPRSNGASQNAAPIPDAMTTPPEAIHAHLQKLQASNDIEPSLKQSLIGAYESILAEIKSRLEGEKVFKELIVLYEAAPNAIAEAKRRKESPQPRRSFADDSLQSYKIETLQSLQIEMQSLAQAATDGRTRVEAVLALREARRKEIPRLLTEDKAAITKVNEELSAPVAEGTDPNLREANSILLRSKLASLNERVRRLEQEQRTYDAEQELLPLRKEHFISEEKFYHGKLKEVTEELNKRRESQIAYQKKLAEGLVALAVPELKARVELLVKRSEDWRELAKNNASLRMEIDAARSRQKLWSDRYKIMTDRISPDSSRHVSNFNSWVGLMLRKQRNELPDPSRLTHELREYQSKILATESLILELDDWKASALALTDGTVPAPVDLRDPESQFREADRYEQQRILSALEHKLVDEFRFDANLYFDSLFNLAETNQQTIDQVRRYQAFIDEHILWIRSSDPLSKSDFRLLWPAVQWLFDLNNWRTIPLQLLDDARAHIYSYFVGTIAFVGLLLNLKRLRRLVHRYGQAAQRSNCTSFVPTAKVLLLCVLLSLPLAFLHLVVGWRLTVTSENNGFTHAIGIGLMISARYFFPLEMIRQISRINGLAECHFQWTSHTTLLLRSSLRWFIDLGIPSVTVVGIISQFGESRWENSLGRITFGVVMALCLIYMVVVLHPRKGVFRDFLARNQGGWIDRLRYIWYFGICSGPLALMAMSLMGYHYTALRLSMHLHTTLIALVGLLITYGLIRRWLLLRRRQIVVSQARHRLEEARKRDPSSSAAMSAQSSLSASDARSDLAQINAQTIRLVTSTLIFAAFGAIAFIWSGVLPAVGVLDTIQLWTVEGPNGTALPITLAHLLLAIPAAIMTVVAARNLPGLVEIALLQHLPLENAVRYAISTLSRYTILIIVIAMTFNSIGVRWASIQWLVAALGVGLGFGLQEIFANFVSGLILLFEQPIRVGDVITLGETTGSVSRIRMRATTVTNFDQQELIIPNKDLITGRLLNWTLTDSTNRMIIAVGIAYESDPDLACRILREVCLEHPNIMKEPVPTAYFEEFGDSTLNLKARFFLANLELRLPTRHELHSQILHRFGAAGIEISFPQRDLHLKTIPGDFLNAIGAAPRSMVAGSKLDGEGRRQVEMKR